MGFQGGLSSMSTFKDIRTGEVIYFVNYFACLGEDRRFEFLKKAINAPEERVSFQNNCRFCGTDTVVLYTNKELAEMILNKETSIAIIKNVCESCDKGNNYII